MELWENNNDRKKPKYYEKNLPQCNSAPHKSHMDWPGIELGSPGLEASTFFED